MAVGDLCFSISVSAEQLATWPPERVLTFMRGMMLVMTAANDATALTESSNDASLAAQLSTLERIVALRRHAQQPATSTHEKRPPNGGNGVHAS